MSDSFFDRSYYIPALWSLVVGVICFVVGVTWNSFQGPEKVIVTDMTTQRDSIKLNITGEDIPSLSEEQLRSVVESELSQLKGIAESDQGGPQVDSSDLPENVNGIQSPPFQMPDVVDGYSIGTLSSIAQASCPASDIERGSVVTLNMTLLNRSVQARLTPIFVNLYKSENDEPPAVVMRQQFELHERNNTLLFVADFPPGLYELRYGVYIKDELMQEYPRFHSKRCDFTLTPLA